MYNHKVGNSIMMAEEKDSRAYRFFKFIHVGIVLEFREILCHSMKYECLLFLFTYIKFDTHAH